MALFSPRFDRKSAEPPLSATPPATSLLTGLVAWLGWAKYETDAGRPIGELDALEVNVVLACCRVIAEAAAAAPMRLLDEAPSKDGNMIAARRIVKDHWAARVIQNPNGYLGGRALREWQVFTACLYGASLTLKAEPNQRNEVHALFPIANTAWSERLVTDGGLSRRVYDITFANGTVETFERDRVQIVNGLSLDGYSAFSPIQKIRNSLGLSRALERQQSKLASAGGRPSGMITSPEGTTPEARTKMSKAMGEKFGANGDGGVMVLDHGWGYEQIAFSSVDQELLGSRLAVAQDICRAFNVPPFRIGLAGSTTYASAEAASRDFYQHSVTPWHGRLEEAYDRDLLLPHAKARSERGFRFDMDDMESMRGSPQDQAVYFTRALGAGGAPAWMTQNEVREKVGLPMIDEPWANTLNRGAMDKIAIAQAGGADPDKGLQLPGEEKEPK